MRRFRFRLARLVRLRRQLLDVQRLELARAVRRLEAIQQAHHRARTARQAYHAGWFRDLAGAGAKAISGDWIRRHWEWMEEGRRRELQLDVARGEAAQAVREATERTVAARRAVRALELLRERRLAAYRREAERQEAAVLDEVAAVRYLRRQRG